jgi:hypothetical protein
MMMYSKTRILNLLKEEFTGWEELLANLSEEQIIASDHTSNLPVKDVVAHLRAWQQISIARLEAAQKNEVPTFPNWLGDSDPEAEKEIDQYNARIYEISRKQSWSQVHREWREGFLRFLELGEVIPETELLDENKYPWLKGYPLLAVLEGSYEHHKEHRESTLRQFQMIG